MIKSLLSLCVYLYKQLQERARVAEKEKAEAEKILQVKRAEGEEDGVQVLGRAWYSSRAPGHCWRLEDSVLVFSENVSGTCAKNVMDMDMDMDIVLVTRYFDTTKDIGASSKSTSVFIPHGPGAVKDVASQIREGLLQALNA